ncbi:hypothetical protein [Streptomyces sp. NPDC020742]|uniref:hypothetical protein n=1 Tax=Streptomyces sp. NPDC020742 TaxID=3154897 RepID=UPI003407030E
MHHPGEEGPLSPYDDRPFGELTELFRHDAVARSHPGRPPAGRSGRMRGSHRAVGWLLPAAAAGTLAAGIVLAHGLLIAGGLVLAGLSAPLPGPRDHRR